MPGIARGSRSGACLHLERELSGVADHDAAHFALLRLQLLEDREHEDSSLPHAGLGLAQDIHAQYRLRYALVLDCAPRRAINQVWRMSSRISWTPDGSALTF